MIETPGDLVWDLPCLQQASCLEGGPLLWIWPLYLHVNQKSDDDDDDEAEINQAFHSTSRYLDNLLNVDNPYFEGMMGRRYSPEL